MIKIIRGNLLDASEDIIGHQTNTKGVWGSGVAKAIKDRFPEAYPTYQLMCHEHGNSLLGKCWTIKTNQKKFIANVFGQTSYGRSKNVVYTDYKALEAALKSLRLRAEWNDYSIALPWMIGCGLANGDWNVVYKIIDEVFEDYEVTLYQL